MPNDNENKFKELLGDLNFFNKLSDKSKGLFKSRDKTISHPDECVCPECHQEALNVYLFGKGDFKG
tara:strand:- start:1065 stop:1262 length:198 start_codon:yes stop_codon:yes gene_type:complete